MRRHRDAEMTEAILMKLSFMNPMSVVPKTGMVRCFL
jgi:hypothetical protein